MKTLADELKEEGFEDGKKENMVDVLTTFLENRFGELSDELVTKIENSSIKNLEKLKDNFFKIESIDEVEDMLE